ncbi:AraC family transcriptional regulator [Pedobacter sp. HMWF019]|uniref:helix-turn-helix domain-containing protein n=1 Tax=Pedobacter sp. HMWF019 TaxID=2056856 RepID=UPI000D3CEF00|nr:helix-turn-helix transcriptional regulator [Pedobacter sp. HMWF019]PTT01841.1 AraC family transcriptional regulator [Pedobacter sp. HMWF019]
MAKTTESLEEFYRHKLNKPLVNSNHIGQFNIFSIKDQIKSNSSSPTYIRRDFYKIMFFQGKNIFHFSDKSIPVNGNTLLFFNPRVPYTYDALQVGTDGYFCVFKDEFLKDNHRMNLNELPLFCSAEQPIFMLGTEESKEVSICFEKMIKELNTDYIYKYELIKNYIMELIYLGIKLQPTSRLYQHPDASSRITAVFTELLERQFPIESTAQRFELRSPKMFADRLAVHVNYLNRAIKKNTGRTTTDHIFERLTSEAKVLLRHTSWSVAEIGYVLGFEDPAHFNHFFKKQTKNTPLTFRSV